MGVARTLDEVDEIRVMCIVHSEGEILEREDFFVRKCAKVFATQNEIFETFTNFSDAATTLLHCQRDDVWIRNNPIGVSRHAHAVEEAMEADEWSIGFEEEKRESETELNNFAVGAEFAKRFLPRRFQRGVKRFRMIRCNFLREHVAILISHLDVADEFFVVIDGEVLTDLSARVAEEPLHTGQVLLIHLSIAACCAPSVDGVRVGEELAGAVVLQMLGDLRGDRFAFAIWDEICHDATTETVVKNFSHCDDPVGLKADDETTMVLAFANVSFIDREAVKLHVVEPNGVVDFGVDGFENCRANVAEKCLTCAV